MKVAGAASRPPPPPLLNPARTFQAPLQALDAAGHAEDQRLQLATRLGGGQLGEGQGWAPRLLRHPQRGRTRAEAQRGGSVTQGGPTGTGGERSGRQGEPWARWGLGWGSPRREGARSEGGPRAAAPT